MLGLVLLGSLLTGCPRPGRATETTPHLTTDDPIAESELRHADQAAETGSLDEAETRYRAFLDDHPSDALVPLAELGLGRLLLVHQHLREALQYFERAEGSYDPVVAERAKFYRGVTLHLLGRHPEALELLRPLRGRLVDEEDTELLHRTIATAAHVLGDPVGAIEALDALASTTELEDLEPQIEQWVLVLTSEQLADAYTRLERGGVAWPKVAQRAIASAYESGDVEQIQRIAADLRDGSIELPADLANLVLRAERLTEADPHVIGAILPLTGRTRLVGQSALHGLMIAAGTPMNGPPDPNAAQLVFRDGAGEPELAAAAVEELVSTHRAIAIVGPLDGSVALVAARRAEQLGVPMISLSAADDVLRVGGRIFRLFPSMGGEMRTLVRAAVRRGARRFATLRPNNPYGEAVRTAFVEAVVAAGAIVVGDSIYEPGATSFRDNVDAMLQSRADAILIPDSARQISLIAPALAAAGLWSGGPETAAPSQGRVITLLFPSVGFDPRLANTTGRYLQQGIFSVPFFAPLASGPGRELTEAALEEFQTPPDVFTAYAYDAFRLIRSVVLSGVLDRDTLTERLAAGVELDTAGASGGIGPNHDSLRATRLIELRGALFVDPEEPAPLTD